MAGCTFLFRNNCILKWLWFISFTINFLLLDTTHAQLYLPKKHPQVERSTTLHLKRTFNHDSVLALTTVPGSIGSFCNESYFILKNILAIPVADSLVIPAPLPSHKDYYLCVYHSFCKESNEGARDFAYWTYAGKYEVESYFSDEGITSYFEDFGAKIYGLRAEGDRVFIDKDGHTQIPANMNVTIRLFGVNFSENTELGFTFAHGKRSSRCHNFNIFSIVKITKSNIISNTVVEIQISLPLLADTKYFYICVKETYDEFVSWVHQGDEPWVQVEVIGRILPMWLQICIILFLLCLSGLFSGLNLGLMALDRLELQVIENCGTETEKKYARIISPLRNRGNYLLCSLLLGNVLVNSTLTILLDDLTSGIIAIISSTMSIVIMGEIIPQALCSRHGLAIGARTVWVTKFFMLATFPLSFPISKILDYVLGEEIGNVYDRERLMEYIRVTKPYNKLEIEEVNIIYGALELKTKTVEKVMTRIKDVFMIPYDAILNFETMSEIMKQGYSRIPVFDGDRNNIVALLNTKDLAFVDPDDNSSLKTLCKFYNHPISYVFEDETLDIMLNEFKKGQSHMSFVRHINSEGDGDPFYEIIGVVTLEDVIEEILQFEIIDETDVLTDNRQKLRRKETQIKQDFSEFAKIGGGQQGRNVISPQLALATYQYLSTSVEPFKKIHISEAILKRLMSQNIFFDVKQSSVDKNDTASKLYEAGKPADYFILILEGRCRVIVGKENLIFEAGPFAFFGLLALSSIPGNDVKSSSQTFTSLNFDNGDTRTFSPDYSVITISPTLYMKIHWTVYLAACRATIMARQKFTNLEFAHQRVYEHDFLTSTFPGDTIYNDVSSPKLSSRTDSQSSLLSRSHQTALNREESPIRRASVEVGCINRCPETVILMKGAFSKFRSKEAVKCSGFTSDMPLTDKFHDLNSLLEDESILNKEQMENKNKGDFSKEKSEETKKKKIQSIESKEEPNERARLLYLSENGHKVC